MAKIVSKGADVGILDPNGHLNITKPFLSYKGDARFQCGRSYVKLH